MTTIDHRPEQRLAADTEDAMRGDRFVAAALLVLAALLGGLQALAGEVIPPLAVSAAIYVVVGLAVARSRKRWLLIVALLLPVLHVVGSIPFFAAALSHPETPASFVPEALVGIVAITVAAGAAVGLRGARPGSRRPILIGAGLAGVAAVVISGIAAAGVASQARQTDDVAVEAVDVRYPETLAVPAGGTLWIDNQDPVRHTFVIEGTDVHVELPGSSAVRVPVDLAPGSYRFLCDVPGHERMAGVIVAS